MSKLRSMVAALGLVLMAPAAEAGLVQSFSTTVDVTGAIGEGGGGNTNRYTNSTTSARSLADYYTFTVTMVSDLGASVLNFNTVKGTNIDQLQLKLQEKIGSVWTDTSAISAVGNKSLLEALEISYASLASDVQYRLAVSGIIAAKSSGNYALNYEVRAVPLPGAVIGFASAIFGLAAYGRRARKQEKAAA